MCARSAHGHCCSCRLLAQAVGCEGSAVAYPYCRSVLQRRWAMVCDHGPRTPPPAVPSPYPEVGPLDSIKAILIGNR